MAGIKYRTPIIATGGFTTGSGGTAVGKILAGTVSACFISTGAGASSAGSAIVTGAAAGDIVFLTTACTTGSAIITSGCVPSANAVSFKAFNIGAGTSAASTITLQYLILGF